jgi:hypothetical protein
MSVESSEKRRTNERSKERSREGEIEGEIERERERKPGMRGADRSERESMENIVFLRKASGSGAQQTRISVL